jgi:hypothetical protein
VKIADKRKAIEVLLCTGDPCHRSGMRDVSDALEMDAACQSAAYLAWSTVEEDPMYHDDWSEPAISTAYTEAAYRLIESSPTLVREWFGAR